MTDDGLLAGFALGDDWAAEEFVRLFQHRVYGAALALLRDVHDAQDVAQETFLRAFRSAATFDPRRGTVQVWLLTIARNLAVDRLRMRRTDSVDPDDLVASLFAPASDDPGETAGANDDLRRVRTLLAALPPEQRRAFVHAAYLGRTAREISDLEGIPLGTAKTRIRTAVLRLRAVLELDGGAA